MENTTFSSVYKLLPSVQSYLGAELLKAPYNYSCATVALEAIFHSSFYASISCITQGKFKKGPFKFINSVCSLTASYAHDIQMVFNLLNAASAVLCTKAIARALEKKYNISFLSPLRSSFNFLREFGVLHVAFGIGVLAINHFLTRTQTRDSQTGTTETIPFQQGLASSLRLTQSALNVILAALTNNRFWLALNLAQTTYAYLKRSSSDWLNLFGNPKIKQVTFSQEITYSPFEHGSIERARIAYHYLKLSPELASLAADDKCGVCFEALNTPNHDYGSPIFSCAHHIFHENCLTRLIEEKFSHFKENIIIGPFNIRYEFNYQPLFEGPLFYSAFIQKTALPSCSVCREPYLHGKLDVVAVDRRYGALRAYVCPVPFNIQRPFTFYNVVEAGLSFLYKYPALATTIFKIQKYLMYADVIEWGFKLVCLATKVSELIDKKIALEKRKSLKIAAAVCVAGLSSLSFLMEFRSRLFVPSPAALQTTLSYLNISPEILKKLTISWDNFPLSHKIMQALYINRLVTNIALAFFSPSDRRLHLIDAVSQGFSLSRLFPMKWIKIDQTLDESFIVD